MSNYMKIKNFDVANGSGIGVSIFLSGCSIHCKGCFNKEAWDFNAGQPFTNKTQKYLMELCGNEHINHLSILGGDPFAPENIRTTYFICREFKYRYPDKKIWCWTGYDYEYLLSEEYNLSLNLYDYIDDIVFLALMGLIDILVDGRFIEEQKDLSLKWRGSKNQRVIDVKETLKNGSVVLYCE